MPRARSLAPGTMSIEVRPGTSAPMLESIEASPRSMAPWFPHKLHEFEQEGKILKIKRSDIYFGVWLMEGTNFDFEEQNDLGIRVWRTKRSAGKSETTSAPWSLIFTAKCGFTDFGFEEPNGMGMRVLLSKTISDFRGKSVILQVFHHGLIYGYNDLGN